MDNTATAERTLGAGIASRAQAIATGVRPRPRPCITRPTRKTGKPSGSAARAQPIAMMAMATRMTPRRCGPSPRRPMVGVAMAPVSSVAVRAHCAVAPETSYCAAMAGSRGAPRLETIAETRQENTSTGKRRRKRKGVAVGMFPMFPRARIYV